jgi:hypothetical protein
MRRLTRFSVPLLPRPHVLLKLRPSFATTVRTDLAKWWQPWLSEPVIAGLCKAGLALAPVKAL